MRAVGTAYVVDNWAAGPDSFEADSSYGGEKKVDYIH